MKVTLELSEKQYDVILKSLDFYARIQCGQLKEIINLFTFSNVSITQMQRTETEIALNKVKSILYGLQPNASYGIYGEQTPEDAKISWDVYQVLRNKISWKLYPDGGITVNFDKPMKTSNKENLINVTIDND